MAFPPKKSGKDSPAKPLAGPVGKEGKAKKGANPSRELKGPVGKEKSLPPWLTKKSK